MEETIVIIFLSLYIICPIIFIISDHIKQRKEEKRINAIWLETLTSNHSNEFKQWAFKELKEYKCL